jgi:hypothetical protein
MTAPWVPHFLVNRRRRCKTGRNTQVAMANLDVETIGVRSSCHVPGSRESVQTLTASSLSHSATPGPTDCTADSAASTRDGHTGDVDTTSENSTWRGTKRPLVLRLGSCRPTVTGSFDDNRYTEARRHGLRGQNIGDWSGSRETTATD